MHNFNGSLSSLERVEAFELEAARVEALEGIASGLDITGLAVGVDMLRETIEAGVKNLIGILERRDSTPAPRAFQDPPPEPDLRPEPGQEFITLSMKPHLPIPDPLGQWVPDLQHIVWLSAAAGSWTLVHSSAGHGKSEQIKGWCARFEQAGIPTWVIASERWTQWQTRIQETPEPSQVTYAPTCNRPSLRQIEHDWQQIQDRGHPEPQVIVFDVWTDMLAGWLENEGRPDREYIVASTRWGIEQVEAIVGDNKMIVVAAHHPEGQDRPVGGVMNNAAVAYTIDADKNLRITKVSEQEEHLTVGDTTIWIKDHENGILAPAGTSQQPVAAADKGGLEKRVRNVIRAQPGISVRKITDALPDGVGVKKTTGILDRLYQTGDIHYHETKPIRSGTRPGYVLVPRTRMRRMPRPDQHDPRARCLCALDFQPRARFAKPQVSPCTVRARSICPIRGHLSTRRTTPIWHRRVGRVRPPTVMGSVEATHTKEEQGWLSNN